LLVAEAVVAAVVVVGDIVLAVSFLRVLTQLPLAVAVVAVVWLLRAVTALTLYSQP
jgi:hypothetical protein